MNEKMSKEVEDIANALREYQQKHNNKVCISVDVCAFDEKEEIIDDAIFMSGVKDILIISLEERLKELKAMKKEII